MSGGALSVTGTTLDDFCQVHGINHIDLLKIDTEGADLLVLKGAAGLLSRGGIDVIICEILFEPIYKGQAVFEDVLSFLRGNGMGFYNLYVQHESSVGRARYGNLLSVKEAMLSGPE